MLDFVIFDYRNKYDMGGILYQTGYRQYFFVDTELSTPAYEIEEDGEQDGDNNFLPTFRKTQKIYNLKFAANAHILDAMYMMQMHVSQFGEVYVQIKNEERAKVLTMAVDETYPQSAELSVVTMRIAVDYKLMDSSNKYTVDCLTSIRDDIAGIKTTIASIFNPPLKGIINEVPYIFDNVTGYVNDVYIYRFAGQWEAQGLNVAGNVVTTTDGDTYYFDGARFKKYPIINSYAESSGTYIIKGFIPFGTFVKLQYKTTGSYSTWSTILTASQFKNVGFQFIKTPPLDQWYTLRVYCYDHNCSYGYSNDVLI